MKALNRRWRPCPYRLPRQHPDRSRYHRPRPDRAPARAQALLNRPPKASHTCSTQEDSPGTVLEPSAHTPIGDREPQSRDALVPLALDRDRPEQAPLGGITQIEARLRRSDAPSAHLPDRLERDGLPDMDLGRGLAVYRGAQIASHEMQRAVLLDAVVIKGIAVEELATGEDQRNLIGGYSRLPAYLRLYVLDKVGRLNLEGEMISFQRQDEQLHGLGWHGGEGKRKERDGRGHDDAHEPNSPRTRGTSSRDTRGRHSTPIARSQRVPSLFIAAQHLGNCVSRKNAPAEIEPSAPRSPVRSARYH